MSNLSVDLAYFIANQDALVHEYGGRVLVLKDGAVVGNYSSALDAYSDATSRFEAGSFSIQACEPGVEAYTVFVTPHQQLLP